MKLYVLKNVSTETVIDILKNDYNDIIILKTIWNDFNHACCLNRRDIHQ